MVDTLEVSVVKKPKDNYEQWMGNYSRNKKWDRWNLNPGHLRLQRI
jgi:hypothetical protein|tara:strand:- start:332 stop:469 length:138 start_codon:yes stop_codon:yes gene_type:complete